MPAVIVENAKELAIALKDKADTIVIEGKFGKAAFRIYAVRWVSWVVAVAAIAVVIALIIGSGILPLSAPLSAPGVAVAAAPAVGILGWKATSAAIIIALGGGGVGILNKFRKYKLIKREKNRLVFKRK